MRITGVRLQNIACFEDLSLDFTNPETGKVAPWVVIVGENGCGKSTLLQMISVTLLSLQNVNVIAPDVDWAGYWRHPITSTYDTYCKISLLPDSSDTPEIHAGNNSPKPSQSDLDFGWLEVNMIFPPTGVGINPVFGSHPILHGTSSLGGWFACGYGAHRRLSGQPSSGRDSTPTIEDSAKPYRFTSVFGSSVGMTDVPDWIAGLYFSSIYTPNPTARLDIGRYESARLALLQALPHISSLQITKDRRVMVAEGDTIVPLERLSDGYRGTLAWIGDLIRRLFDAYPNSDDPLKESGVVLVDEIDLHLHPKWQRSVVEDVRKLFPNLQFIVTSHSPFVAQDMRPEDKIIVLERSGKDGKGPVVAREENGSLESWSADQILTDYFGLDDGTRGTKTQKAEQRFVRLLGAEATGKLTAKQAKELEQLRGKVNAIPLGETPDERAFYKMADDVVAMLHLRTAQLEASSNGVHEETQSYDSHADDVSDD